MQKLTSFLLLVFCVVVAACACAPAARVTEAPSTPEVSNPVAEASQNPAAAANKKPTVVALAPSINETLAALGLGGSVIGYDTNSAGIAGIAAGLPQFDLMSPDAEKIVELSPDILFVTNMSFTDSQSAKDILKNAGVEVIEMPNAASVADIKKDIITLAEKLNEPAKGRELVGEFEAELSKISGVAKTIPENERKKVYFEISAAPDIYSTGSGTYMDEMIELIGAKNILSDEDGWLAVAAEEVAQQNPDVILTNVDYIEDPVGEILSRTGWANVTALKDKAVYKIDKSSSSQPNLNIIKAIKEMAKAVYPEYYKEI